MIEWTDLKINRLKHLYLKGSSKEDISNALECSISSVTNKLFRLALKRPEEMKYVDRSDVSYLNNVSDYRVAYLLGFFWADGYTSDTAWISTISFSRSDYKDIEEAFESCKDWKIYFNKNRPKMISLHKSGKNFNSLLRKFDYVIKSGASPDKILAHIPEHLRHYWWRGYFDGDGCFHISDKDGSYRVSLVSCADQDWSFCEKLCQELSLPFNVEYRKHRQIYKKENKIYHSSLIRWNNMKDCDKFLSYIYSGERIELKRKRDKFTTLKQRLNRTRHRLN